MLRSHSLLMLQATDRPMGMIWLDVASLRPFDLVIPFTIQKGEVTGEVRMASGKVAKLDITDNNDGTVADKYAPTEAGLHEMDIKYDGTHIPGSPLQFYMDCMNGAYGPGLIHDPSGDVPRLHAWKHSARNPLLHPSPAAEPQTTAHHNMIEKVH
ncbi:filamin-A-like isoform X2 [Oreochromis aureus]|uniref:filamin-A-like isoform X2 n=1 Tax=Oreochromis aureus TaxID=47969 RepID=UPI0019542740|nr:filamin-A-like isoform X2 [Oreochromis aureus]